MANALKCDRCGSYFDYSSATKNFIAFGHKDIVPAKNYPIKDICPDCMLEFMNWFEAPKEAEDEDKVAVLFNEAMNGIKTYAEEKKDPCAGLTCYEEKEDGVYYRCTECTHTHNAAEGYHYYECAKKGKGIAIPDKDSGKGLVIEPYEFDEEEF